MSAEIADSHWLLSLVVQQGYLLLFLGVLLDNVGLPLPAELILLTFGFLARTGHLDAGWGLIAAVTGAIAGDNVSYWLGRLGGSRILHTYCRLTFGSGQCVQKAVSFYHRFGQIAIILGRFVVGLRAFVMPLAGSARVPYGQFLIFAFAGALLWSTLFIAVGYLLGGQVGIVGQELRRGEMLVGLGLAIAFLGYLAISLWKQRRYERLHGG